MELTVCLILGHPFLVSHSQPYPAPLSHFQNRTALPVLLNSQHGSLQSMAQIICMVSFYTTSEDLFKTERETRSWFYSSTCVVPLFQFLIK